MTRMMHLSAVFLTLGSALALYAVKYDTLQLEARVRAGERGYERLEADIAALAAERAYLARPERIQDIAKSLGLRPTEEKQYTRIEDLPAVRDIVTGTLPATPASPPAPPVR
jgi:cell division protein FtsL